MILPKLKPLHPNRSKIFLSSSLALFGMLAHAQPEQQTDEGDLKVQEVVVKGVKRSLMNAQDIKRDADTMVDAISAEDIGVLPDRSVLDAMQRLPGVAIERFAGPNDPDHFSVEASGVLLRGMIQTRSEFNGRDSFTANTGRGLSFQDISPELMGGVEIYKNQTADMIEGGIGGTITLNTRKPFDIDERMIAFSIDYSYGDIAKEATPTFSGLLSEVWDTPYGKLGVLFNYANSRLIGESNGIQSDAFVQYYASELPGAEAFLTFEEQQIIERLDAEGETPEAIANELAELQGRGVVWIPNAANLLIKEDERKREGTALAVQFAAPDESLEATFQFMRSDSRLAWNERAIKYQGGYFDINQRPTAALAGTEFSFDDAGLFQSGVLVEEGDEWRVHPSGRNRVPVPSGGLYEQWGHKTQMDSRVNDLSTLIEDYAFHVTWAVSDQLTIDADFQYIEASTKNDDMAVHINTWAGFDYDISGSVPTVTMLEPWFGVRDAARARGEDTYETGYPGFSGDELGDSNFFQDLNSYAWTSAMDHYERSEGISEAFRLDGEYRFENFGILRGLKAGVRKAKREQLVRYTGWNWGQTTPYWTSGIGWLPETTEQLDGFEVVDWSDFMGGGVANIPGNKTVHANEAFIRSLMGADPQREIVITENREQWVPFPQRDDVPVNHPAFRVLDDKYGMFSPGEVNGTVETRNAVYLRLDFEGGEELPFSGNVGLRYFAMDRDAIGAVIFESLVPDTEARPPEDISLPLSPSVVVDYFQARVENGEYPSLDNALTDRDNQWVNQDYYYLSDNERGFANGHEQLTRAKTSTHKLLPSFNIKVELTPELVGRVAFAKALAFPDMNDVRNRVELEAAEPKTNRSDEASDLTQIQLITDSEIPSWVGGGGNPYIQPMESVQYDFSLEWYFSDAGQLSAALFHKNLSNYFVQGITQSSFTNEITGATNMADITSTHNSGKAKLDGVEISYHQFFDGWFEGVGLQGTYTYIDATGAPNNEVDIENERWFDSRYEDTGINVDFNNIPLQGLSDHTLNLMLMYDLEPWNARLSYNWRSRYLLTTRDVISKAPQWYDAHGELDGSVFYSINDQFTVGLQGTNLTNERSDILMILNDELLSTGRSWFLADRRIALVFKAQF